MKEYLLTASILIASSNAISGDFSGGLGLGIPYGVLGTNLNYKVNDSLDAFIGLGLGLGAGVRYHPLESNRKIRLTAYTGTYGLIINGESDEIDRFNGVTLGVGYGAPGRGWDVDLMYITDTTDISDKVDELTAKGYQLTGNDNAVKISFGYHF